jgi:hypothetical protein
LQSSSRLLRNDSTLPSLRVSALAGIDLTSAALADELEHVGVVPRIADAVAFADENQVLLMKHAASGVEIDVSRAWLPFELEALAAAKPESLGGVRIAITLASRAAAIQFRGSS